MYVERTNDQSIKEKFEDTKAMRKWKAQTKGKRTKYYIES
jgi:hypothetical protein